MKESLFISKVFLVGFWPDYEEFFFEGLSTKDLSIETFNPASVSGVQKFFLSKSIRPLKNKIYISNLRRLIKGNPTAFYVFQDSRLLLEFLASQSQSPDSPKCSVMLRNIVKPDLRSVSLIERLIQMGVPLWSFDAGDCERYGLNFYPQFIKRHEEVAATKAEYDFSFVGRDKNRASWLYHFKEKAEKEGFSVYLDIRGSKKKDTISYVDYLKGMCKGRCFIDLVQPGQIGVTLRPLEGALYGRRVISNNSFFKDNKECSFASVKYFCPDDDDLNMASFLSGCDVGSDVEFFKARNVINLMLERSDC